MKEYFNALLMMLLFVAICVLGGFIALSLVAFLFRAML